MHERVTHEREPLRVGLVGAGYVSSYHLRALQSLRDVEIVGIADPNLSRAEQVANKFNLPAAYRSLAEMAWAKPQVIHVLTPPAWHCGLTLDALDLGCHVFVEKPMAETPGECDRMIAKAKAVGRVLSVNHSARMDPIILRALELVKNGACGEILAVDFFRSSDYPPYRGGPVPATYKDGAYPFQDLGVHGLYLLEAFLGRIENADVRYFSSGHDPNLVFDEWRVLAQCEKGTGQMYLSWTARPMRNELVVHGTRGILQVDCFLQTCVLREKMPGPKFAGLVAGVIGNSAQLLCTVPLNVARFATGRLLPSPGIHTSICAFYEALRRGGEPPVSAAEGRRIVAYMHEASSRANLGRKRRLGLERPVPPARILVTGASGFLGRALMQRLRKRNEPVRVLVRRPAKAFEGDPLIHQVCGDLGDPEAVDRALCGIDVVYHVGAAMRGGSADFERGTVWGARNIVASCLKHSVKRLIYVSSLTVLDHAGHAAGEPVTESSPLEPHADRRGFYTQTKLEAEGIVLDAVREHNLPALILRPGQIFGRGAEKVPPSGTIAVAGRWVVVGSGELQLPLVYVEDVVDALLLAEERDCAAGSIFHLVDPEVVSQNEYLELCRNAPGNDIRILRPGAPVLYGSAILAEALGRLLRRKAPLSRYRLRSARPISPCDCSAAREKLGWTPRIGTRQGLKREFQRREAAEPAAVVQHSPELMAGAGLER
jgi:predicted dehydrogenase/nucleoside-diphosphate-sugar epimerase